jgi:diacylglycerol O-acyltransferase-1
MFVVFLLSAIVHEVLISVPFHLIRPWSFLGMMAQIPLVFITKYCDDRWPGSSVGNIIFWISFCIVGQPVRYFLFYVSYVHEVAILFYDSF